MVSNILLTDKTLPPPKLEIKELCLLNSSQIFFIVCEVKMRTSLVMILCVALLFSLLSPQVEGAVGRVRGRGGVGRRVVGGRRSGRRQGGRRMQGRRRRGRTGAAPPPDADVVTDEDFEKEDEGAVEAAGALGDLAGICEILMFDRGEGSYSLKFIKNC